VRFDAGWTSRGYSLFRRTWGTHSDREIHRDVVKSGDAAVNSMADRSAGVFSMHTFRRSLTFGALMLPARAAFPGKNGRIAFVYGPLLSATAQLGDAYTMNSDGTHVLQLTHFGPSFTTLASYENWSPRGRQSVSS
jgi:hypothetical protein